MNIENKSLKKNCLGTKGKDLLDTFSLKQNRKCIIPKLHAHGFEAKCHIQNFLFSYRYGLRTVSGFVQKIIHHIRAI